MTGWIQRYQSRVSTAEKAVRAIQPGMRVFLTGNCSVPQRVMATLVEYAPAFDRPIEIVQVLTIGSADYVAPAMEKYIRVNTLFISADVRKAVNEGRADFTPIFLSEIPGLFRTGIVPLDVALIHVSPPDEHGFCSFGVEVGVTKTAAGRPRWSLPKSTTKCRARWATALSTSPSLLTLFRYRTRCPSTAWAKSPTLKKRLAPTAPP